MAKRILSDKTVTYTIEEVDDLIQLLKNFPGDYKVCNVLGGPVTVTLQPKDPETIWFE